MYKNVRGSSSSSRNMSVSACEDGMLEVAEIACLSCNIPIRWSLRLGQKLHLTMQR